MPKTRSTSLESQILCMVVPSLSIYRDVKGTYIQIVAFGIMVPYNENHAASNITVKMEAT